MLKDVVNRVKGEIEYERKNRLKLFDKIIGLIEKHLKKQF